jgi:sulfotransferase
MKSLSFLSGLPRTGSTLLASILNQNKKIHCTSTSGLLDFLSGVNYVYNETSKRSLEFNEVQLKSIFKSISNSYYNHIQEDIVIDKWRGWIANVPQIEEIIISSPKIICTYRPIEEIIVSFLDLLEKDPENFIDKELNKNSIQSNNFNRAKYLWENGVVGETYKFFIESLSYKKFICYISYDEIVNQPNKTMDKIYNHLEIDTYQHSYENINTKIFDNDSFWQIKNLHTIRNQLSKYYKNPLDYLDIETVEYYKSFNKIFLEL